jgi:ribosome-associated heat shock protein Hsp15
VKAGDVLTIGLDRAVRVLKVIGFSERRGDATAARVLYEDLQARPE